MCRPHALSAHTSTFTGVQHHGSLLGSVCRLGYPQQAATIRSGSMTCNGMPDISALQYVHHLKAYFKTGAAVPLSESPLYVAASGRANLASPGNIPHSSQSQPQSYICNTPECPVSVNTQYDHAVRQLCSNQEPAQSIIAQSQGSCFPKLHQHPDCASSQAAGDDAGKPCKDVAPHIIRLQTR
jgi:hypothetical protein